MQHELRDRSFAKGCKLTFLVQRIIIFRDKVQIAPCDDGGQLIIIRAFGRKAHAQVAGRHDDIIFAVCLGQFALQHIAAAHCLHICDILIAKSAQDAQRRRAGRRKDVHFFILSGAAACHAQRKQSSTGRLP